MKTQISLFITFFLSMYIYAQQPSLNIITNNMDADTVTICSGDSVSMYSTGLVSMSLFADFNDQMIPNYFTTNINYILTNPCGSFGADGTPYFWINNGFNPRYISTIPICLSPTTEICFDFKMAVQGDASPCEGPDEMDEGVSLQYSTDYGTSWVDIAYFCPDGNIYPSNIWGGSSTPAGGIGIPFNSWANYCFSVPPGAISGNTMIRWFQDYTTDLEFDSWGLDNIQILNQSANITWYENGTVLAVDTVSSIQYPAYNTEYSLMVTDCTGTYYDTVFVIVDQHPPMEVYGLQNHYCSNDTPVTFTYTPPGAQVNGPGISGNTFDPTLAGPGIHNIELQYSQTIYNNYFSHNVPFWIDSFSTDLGWTGYGFGGWERDSAEYHNNCNGTSGPGIDHSAGPDEQILGTYIGDCYPHLDNTYWIESPTIDCSGKENCIISFYSFSDFENTDSAFISVFDGSNWIELANQNNFSGENYWQQHVFNVSNWADNNPAFRIRFGIGPTDTVNFFKGWYIDDVVLSADGIISDTTNCDYIHSIQVEVDTAGIIQEICMVTVDTALMKNKIIWEKTDPHADMYYIYKETAYAGVYDLIGTTPAINPGIYIDSSSIPSQQSSRYKISAIDSCGNISSFGTPHKTIHLNVSTASPQGYELTWEQYEGFNFGTYIIYRGDSYSTLDSIHSIAYSPGVFTFTDLNPPSGTLYYMIGAMKDTPCNPNTSSKTVNTVSNSNVVVITGNNIQKLISGQIQIFPNPCRGIFTLLSEKYYHNLKLCILDISGKKVFSDNIKELLTGQSKSYDLDLKPGIYFIQISETNATHYIKLIVQ
ncbi:MAG: hypothetical protein Kow0068_05530 [Marinilabiliales bacterium]